MHRAGGARLPRQANTSGLLSERSEPPGTERAGGFMVKIAGGGEPVGTYRRNSGGIAETLREKLNERS